MNKYLITGGAGFIGCNFCYFMVDKYKDDLFICVDDLTYAGNINSIRPLFDRQNFKFYKANICNEDDLNEIFKTYKFDYVINFAAESSVDRSINNPNIFMQTNVLGVLNLLNLSLKYKVKRFHQISTDEVYGDLPLENKGERFNENSLLKPSSPYSVSKASADLLTLSYFRTYNLNVTISRCSNNFGPYQHVEKLIPCVIMKGINNEYIPVYGNGKNVRDWIYVYDHLTAIDLIVHKGTTGEIYNIGANNEKDNLDIINYLLKKLNKSNSLIKFVEDRKGHDLRYSLDCSKIKKELGWESSFSFEKGIEKTINWYLQNQDWIKENNKNI